MQLDLLQRFSLFRVVRSDLLKTTDYCKLSNIFCMCELKNAILIVQKW